MSPRSTGKMMDFDYRKEYLKGLKGVYQTKYYYGSIKKKQTFSFSSRLQTDKKAKNVKEDPGRKTFFFILKSIYLLFNKYVQKVKI